MMNHPVYLRVEETWRPQRVHVFVRVLLLVAVGTLGYSSLYWAAYLAMPAVAAMLLVQRGAERYLAQDAPRVVKALRWLAAAYAYLWLLTDEIPTSGVGPVDLRVEIGGQPTPVSALLRLLTSLPVMLLLALLSIVGGVCWLVGAVCILAVRRVPAPFAGFLALVLRLQFRMITYHLSLVDRYPSLAETPPPGEASGGAGLGYRAMGAAAGPGISPDPKGRTSA